MIVYRELKVKFVYGFGEEGPRTRTFVTLDVESPVFDTKGMVDQVVEYLGENRGEIAGWLQGIEDEIEQKFESDE